jgi:hypothetical protein
MRKQSKSIQFESKEWKRDFLKKESLSRIINCTDISGYHFYGIEKTYTVNQDRVGAIVLVQNYDEMLRVAIDFKSGFASWNQIIDLTYNLGDDCDYKIAVHGDNSEYADDQNDYHDSIVAERLADVLLAYGVNIKLVTAEVQSDDQGEIKFNFSHDTDFRCITEKFTSKLPFKRLFEETEFMLFHWGRDDEDEYRQFMLWEVSEWPLKRGKEFRLGRIIMNDLDLYSTWSDRGFFLNAAPESDEGIGKLEWIWENKQDELKIEYFDCDIRMHTKDGRASKLSIRLLERPFNQLVHAHYREKNDLGFLAYSSDSRFGEFLEELLDDMSAMKTPVNS